MKEKLIIKKEGVIAAPAEKVWEIITTPEYFKDWMFVPGHASNEKSLKLGSRIQWINEENIVYLEGKVIEFIKNKKIVISLKDISWQKEVPETTVTYEFHLTEEKNGTKVRFFLGDLSIDPAAEDWYNAYKSSNEITAITNLIEV